MNQDKFVVYNLRETYHELGEFESGLVAAWLGLLPAIVIGGVATLLVTLLWAWLFPSLSRMDRFPKAPSEPA